jgi:hypothetical protein
MRKRIDEVKSGNYTGEDCGSRERGEIGVKKPISEAAGM